MAKSFEDYGLTPNGYVVPTESELKSLILSTAQALGVPIDQEQYSIKEIYFTLANDLLKRCYEREAYKVKQNSKATATGEALDELAEPITRYQAQTSSAKCVLSGVNNTIIEAGSRVRNPYTNDFFSNATDCTITNYKCVRVVLDVDDFVAGDYSITIDGHKINKAFTQEQIDNGLTLAQALNEVAVTVNATEDVNAKIAAHVEQEQLIVESLSPLDEFACEISALYKYSSVSSVGIFFAEEEGTIEVEADTINEISTVITGWDTVNNPVAGNMGRAVENDEDFRVRALAGGATKYATREAIESALLKVANVVSASVSEEVIATLTNNNIQTKIYGIKSVVLGGEPNDIAQAIEDTKAAGALTVGTSSGIAVDSNGVQHTRYFTRPTIKYAWIKVKLYNTNDATLPEYYADAVKTAIMSSSYIAKHAIGQEITPCYISSAVCEALTLIGNIDTTIATTISPSIAPQDDDYQDSEIIVDAETIILFNASRIDVEIVNVN